MSLDCHIAIRGVVCTLLLVSILVSPLPAQRAPAGDEVVINLPDDSPADVLRQALFDRWFAWKSHLREGDLAAAEQLEQEILSLLESGKIPGVDILAGATAREGFSLLEAGRAEEAEMAFRLASEVQPDLPQIHFGKGALALQADRDPVTWARNHVEGLILQFRGLWGGFLLRTNLYLILAAGVGLFAGGFALLQTVKHHRQFRHSVSERLSKRMTSDVGQMVGLGILLLPAILWLGPVVLLLWWLAMLYAYMDTKERSAAWLAVVGIALLPFLFHQVHGNAAYLDSPVVSGVHGLTTGEVDARDLQGLEEAVNDRPDQTKLRFLYATALMEAAREEEAKMQLRKITEQDPGAERAWLNLGNLYFREGDLPRAVEYYTRATEAGSCYALAHYNLAITRQNQLESKLYEEQMAIAKDCDQHLVSDLAAQEGLQDASLASREIKELIHTSREDSPERQLPLMSAYLNPITVLALVAMLWMGMKSTGRTGAPARSCIKCGRAFCSACQPGAETSAYCTQCLHLYIKKDGVAPSVRVQKSREVERHAARRRWGGRGLNFLLPGSTDILEDRIPSGVFTLASWGLLLAALLVGGRLVEYPRQVVDAGSAFLLGVNLTALFVVWAWSNLVPLVTRR